MALNLLRTHDTPSQRAAFAERVANATKADARKLREAASSNCYFQIITRDAAARALGVEKNAVSRVRRIRRAAAPDPLRAIAASGVRRAVGERD